VHENESQAVDAARANEQYTPGAREAHGEADADAGDTTCVRSNFVVASLIA
jgi:hypothetical protein